MDDSISADYDSLSDMLSSDDEVNTFIHNKYESEDIMAMIFSSEESGFEFYNKYALFTGFSIRKDIVRRDRRTNVVVHRRFLCSKAGLRDLMHIGRQDRTYRERDLTRCQCQASLSIRLDLNTNKWFVYDFEDAHNHELAPSDQVTFLRSHRRMDAEKKSEVRTCFESGMRKSQTMSLMECKQGGYEKVGFISKDLYNFASVEGRKSIVDGDAQTVIGYLAERKRADCEFFFKYEKDKSDCLTNVFWADSQSILDYIAYGDVLLFDSTYRTNRYGMPFIPFIGVNHHRKSTLFGCGLVIGETSNNYKWLLKSFLEAMCQKPPISVITDGDNAMREAIISIFPSTTHRLCAWHISRNLTQNIKDNELLFKFKVLIYDACAPAEFEEKWKRLIIDHKIKGDNKWFNLMYKKRKLWAAAYLHGKYFLGMVSTQRSESMNAVFHRYLDRKMNLLNMVKHYERCLSRMRRDEAHDDCIASQSSPVTKSELQTLEQHAIITYTPNVFRYVQNEILSEGLEPIDDVYYVGEGQRMFEIGLFSVVSEVIDGMLKVSCDCLKWQEEGIPCRHLFSIMKYFNLVKIPDSCILKRWTKHVKLGFPSYRYGGLHTIDRNKSFKRQSMGVMNELLDKVLDPGIVSSKGAPKKRIKSHIEIRQYKCGYCRSGGHTRRTCPTLKEQHGGGDI